jgi:hypothetical protein
VVIAQLVGEKGHQGQLHAAKVPGEHVIGQEERFIEKHQYVEQQRQVDPQGSTFHDGSYQLSTQVRLCPECGSALF